MTLELFIGKEQDALYLMRNSQFSESGKSYSKILKGDNGNYSVNYGADAKGKLVFIDGDNFTIRETVGEPGSFQFRHVRVIPDTVNNYVGNTHNVPEEEFLRQRNDQENQKIE